MEEKVQSRILSFFRDVFFENFVNALSSKRFVLIRYNDKKSAATFDLIKKIKRDRETWVTYNEAYQIAMLVQKTKKISGDVAEVGVFKGGTAKIIAQLKGKKNLYLFDTFEGLPDRTKHDDAVLYKGRFNVFFEEVKAYFKNEKGVFFYKGIFPQTAASIENKHFSFVHLDVDLYRSTLDSLKFFYPRMSKGGVIISHDYMTIEGVSKAFDKFFEDKPEAIIELSGSQCLVVKI